MKILPKTHLKQLDFYLAKLRLDRYFESGNKENQQYFQIVGIKNQAAWKKDVETCGDCPDMESCQTVGEIISNNPDALKNLRG